IHQTWSQLMCVSSSVTTSWLPGVRCLPAFNPVAPPRVTVVQTPSLHASSVSSAPDTCRVCGGTTGIAMVAKSSSSVKTAPFLPAASEENS
ncbi:hypothetical protein XENOCAPTIV_016143, partial [Xenoophorus captivus]